MAFYAQTNNTGGLVGQEEMVERRRIAETIKQIEERQHGIRTSLDIWLRCVEWAAKHNQPIPESADQAMERLIQARREENQLFKTLFGIDAERRALPKR